ncbi:MAG: copper amine oxidase N-terminal domain-containing protein [Clostridia bacterium]|nr:copper amine oxidase N-terminal domain-containing protein [Clostridia bacterium]
MKKLISILLIFTLALSSASAVFAEDDAFQGVEISFKIGDSTLTINGSPVEVETPYIAGEGTTLVPLRVITEAFGATVTWVDETKEIYLEYPDVSVVLQIGSTTAKVNSHTETLPVAPELSANGVTMVPLRFISETFGAIVGWDEATSSVTVVKEEESEGSTISAINDMPRIGDSYFGWSMNTPTSLFMSERDFDGTYTEFSDEDGGYICISIYEVDQDTTFEQRYNSQKESLSSLTLSLAEKDVDSLGRNTMHFKARSKEVYFDLYKIEDGSTVYDVVFITDASSASIPTYTALSESFSLSFGDTETTYDLSTVDEDGYRFFTDDDLKVSFKVPATLSQYDTNTTNSLYFSSYIEDDVSSLQFAVYSLSETGGALAMATEDRSVNALYANPEYVTVTNIFEYKDVNIGKNAYYFAVSSKGLPGGDEAAQEICFELGDYVYTVVINMPLGQSTVASEIMKSFTAEELDSESTGTILRNRVDRTTSFTSTAGSYSITVPSSWTQTSSGSNYNFYTNKLTYDMFSFSVNDSSGLTASDAKEYAEYVYKNRGDGRTSVQRPQLYTYGGKSYYTWIYYMDGTESGSRSYVTCALLIMNGKVFQFMLMQDAFYYNSGENEEFVSVLESLKVN